MRRVAKRLSRHASLKQCGMPAPLEEGEEREGVEVRAVEEEEGRLRAYFYGLRSCRSPHVCPICAERLAAARSEEIAQAAPQWAEGGGQLVFATFTLRHHWGEPLRAVLRRLSRAWRRMVSSRSWKEGVRVHYAGFIRSLEVTLGPNGWHAHYHALFFFYWDEIPSYEEVFSLWSAAVEAEGGECVKDAFSWEVVPPADVQEVGRYLAKWGPGGELAKGRYKRSVGLSPWEILKLAGLEAGLIVGEVCVHALQHAKSLGLPSGVSWVALWREYEEATRGLRSVYWSRGLRELFRFATDEEHLMRGPEDYVVLGTLSLPDYWRLWKAELDQEFLAAVELHGWEAGLVILAMAPPLGPPPTPPPTFSDDTRDGWRTARERLGFEPEERPAPTAPARPAPTGPVQPALFGREQVVEAWLAGERGGSPIP